MKTLNEFLNRIIENNKGSDEARKELEPYKAKGTTGFLEEGQGSFGGFTTPDELFDEVLEVVLENSIIRPRATVVRMTSDTMSVSYSRYFTRIKCIGRDRGIVDE
jgi:HK97 family phage major capsid protein